MKILCACDWAITPDMVMGMKQEMERLGNTFEIFDNEALHSTTALTELMLKTEVEGPESVDADPRFLPLVKDADILITHMTVVNKAVIDAASKLTLAVVMRGGCDNVNVEYLHQKNITTINASWRSSYAVADFTVGMILAEIKNIARAHHYLFEGHWERNFPNTVVNNLHDLRTKTVGIIGFGFIGQRVAKNLSGFDCKIMVHDPFLPPEAVSSKGYTPCAYEELLKTADIVTMHLRYSEKTKHFMAKKHFAMMKPTAYFINTARAGLVEEEALLDALQNNKIQGAAIDVYTVEPLPKDNPYVKLKNVTITPHMAGISNDTMTNSVEIVFEDLKRFFKGEKLQCIV
jgi:D-3-phosphoglycerate dehydrogenase